MYVLLLIVVVVKWKMLEMKRQHRWLNQVCGQVPRGRPYKEFQLVEMVLLHGHVEIRLERIAPLIPFGHRKAAQDRLKRARNGALFTKVAIYK